MKKKLKTLAPGDSFGFAGERFVVLDHMEDGTFVLTEGFVGTSPFQENDGETRNDYSKSTLKECIDDFVAKLPRNSNEAAAILPFELDLRPTDLSNGYGTIEVRAAPLTLWQYGKYKDIIPLVDDWWWLATPLWTRWLRSPSTNGTSYAWCVYSGGDGNYGNCFSSYGVRPALKLNSELLVSVDSEDCDLDCENCDCKDCGCSPKTDLSWISDEDLLREVQRRLSKETSEEDDE